MRIQLGRKASGERSPLNILNAEPEGYSTEARSWLQRLGRVEDGPVTREQLIRSVGSCDILIVRLAHQIDREVIAAGRRLRAIVSATTGLDHIDLEVAKARGVKVLSLRGETEFLKTIVATPEHTWALLLAVVRKIPWAFESARSGTWDRDAFRGHELAGRTLGILGVGRVGGKVASYAVAFGMELIGFDPYQETWPPHVHRVDSVRELCERCDVLTVHVPLNDETRGLVGAAELVALGSLGILINTARGAVVDEQSLLSSLSVGGLAAAAVDVVEGERAGDLAEHPLVRFSRENSNLLVTPHIAGATFESMERTEVFMVDRLAQFLDGLV